MIVINTVSGPETDYDEISFELWHRLGNDQPIVLHYLRWMGLMKQEDGLYHGVLQGDLGQSLWEAGKVTTKELLMWDKYQANNTAIYYRQVPY